MVYPAIIMCRYCAHWRTTTTCDAYPDGIPLEVLFHRVDHRQFLPGDGGIKFLAKDEEAQRIVDTLPTTPTLSFEDLLKDRPGD